MDTNLLKDAEKIFYPLIDNIKPIYEEEERWQKKYNSYNIFEVLGIERKEVKLHSNFIYNLLDSDASHGKSSLLMKNFLEKVLNFSEENLKEFDEDDYVFEREVYADENSRIDFILYEKETDHAHVIEMKIDACDQDKQLKRYDTFAKKNYTKYTLYYLTLDEKEASYESARNIQGYENITFKNHISSWLETSLSQLEKLPLTEKNSQFEDMLNQYLIVVNKISGNIETKEFEEKYLQCITNENVKLIEKLTLYVEDLKNNTLNEFNKEIYTILEKKFPNLNLTSEELVEDEYVSISIKKVKDLNNLCLNIAKENTKLYFGICVYNNEYKVLDGHYKKYTTLFKSMNLKKDIGNCIYYQYFYNFIEDECIILSDKIKKNELKDAVLKILIEKIKFLDDYKEEK